MATATCKTRLSMSTWSSFQAQHWPAQVGDMPQMSIVLKASGTSPDLYPVIKSILQSLDPRVFPEIRPLESLSRGNVVNVERIAVAVSLVAVPLAGVGIVGLVAYTASLTVWSFQKH